MATLANSPPLSSFLTITTNGHTRPATRRRRTNGVTKRARQERIILPQNFIKALVAENKARRTLERLPAFLDLIVKEADIKDLHGLELMRQSTEPDDKSASDTVGIVIDTDADLTRSEDRFIYEKVEISGVSFDILVKGSKEDEKLEAVAKQVVDVISNNFDEFLG